MASIDKEFKAAREAVALMDIGPAGFIEVTGADRFSWIQGLTSNDVRPLMTGAANLATCFLDATGHLLAVAELVTVTGPPPSLLIVTDEETASALVARLQGFVIMEDVEATEASDRFRRISLEGPLAEITFARAEAAAPLPLITHFAADHSGAGGILMICATDKEAEARRRLLEAGAVAVGPDTTEVLRVEAGIPAWGKELTAEIIPLEAGLGETHISFTKGCYIGQEVIARIRSRGHTNRELVKLYVNDGAAVGDALLTTIEGVERQVERITSVAVLPDGRTAAIGYARRLKPQ